ncbi:MAG: cell division protein ZipA C-terminal FtsZ-binding domain-containing protein [Lautropia sp.]|nr:cell division protein ZipA C-terminal FtsZ-binding domain-containing protein [Lautropia sp.]
MSTLSWSIIGLVVLVLLIVIAHNVIQGRRQQEERLSLRKGHFQIEEDDDPDTLTAMNRSGWHERDDDRRGGGRRDPVFSGGRGDQRKVPPSLAARPHRFDQQDDERASRSSRRDSDDRGARSARQDRDEDRAMYPSLRVDDEDFVETPFENPAAVRPWSSSEDAAARKAAAQRVHEDSRQGRSHADRDQDHRRESYSGRGDVVGHRGDDRVAAGFDGSLADPQARREAVHSMRARDEGRDRDAGMRGSFGDDDREMSEEGRQGARKGAHTGRYFSDEPSSAPAARSGRSGGAGRPAMPANPFEPPADRGAARGGAASALPASLRARADEDEGIDDRAMSRRDPYGTDEDELPASSGAGGRVAADRDEYASEDVADDPAPDHGSDRDASVDALEADADSDLPDAPVEHVMVLEPPSPINTDRLVVLTSSLRHVGGKPVRIEVERLGGHWGPLTAGEKAVRMRCSLLLANRQGPLHAVELSDFNAAVESLAEQIQAPVTIPDMAPILRNARELDVLAAKLDTQIEVRVELPAPAELASVTTLVRQLGLSDKGSGRYEAYADSGDMLFALAFNKSRDQIDFVLDVPRTAEHHEAWEGMVACASSMAQALGGRLVDSAGRGMSVGMIKTVEKQLAQRYAQLNQVGLRAGGPAAMRVFH